MKMKKKTLHYQKIVFKKKDLWVQDLWDLEVDHLNVDEIMFLIVIKNKSYKFINIKNIKKKL